MGSSGKIFLTCGNLTKLSRPYRPFPRCSAREKYRPFLSQLTPRLFFVRTVRQVRFIVSAVMRYTALKSPLEPRLCSFSAVLGCHQAVMDCRSFHYPSYLSCTSILAMPGRILSYRPIGCILTIFIGSRHARGRELDPMSMSNRKDRGSGNI